MSISDQRTNLKLVKVKKVESAAKLIFPDAPVPLAAPKDMAIGTPLPTIQRH